jgi:hypothetical protein
MLADEDQSVPIQAEKVASSRKLHPLYFAKQSHSLGYPLVAFFMEKAQEIHLNY